jgi:2,5-diketo-D-gluconate reductase B
MQSITLNNGVEIPQLGLGTYQMRGDECEDAVTSALDMGYRHIDTAEFYNNETAIGRAIADYNRDDLFITSKVWRTNLEHDDVIRACNDSLDRLNTDYLDLYLIHWPNNDVNLEETLNALHELYDEGKIKAVGVSNFTVNHIKETLEVSNVPITNNQVEFHPFLYQQELMAYCFQHDIAVTAYAPIARNKVAENDAIKAVAEKHCVSPAQVSIAWLLKHGIVAIPKSSTERHLRENWEAQHVSLDEEDMARIDDVPQERLIEPGFAEFDH